MVSNPETAESKVNSLAYCSSKSAVTMLTLQYAKGLLINMQINAADPGATNTDLVGDFSNNSKHVSEGIKPIIQLATIEVQMAQQVHLLMAMEKCLGRSILCYKH